MESISVASMLMVDRYNAWVREHFGEDPNLLMQKITSSTDLSKPILIANNTTFQGDSPCDRRQHSARRDIHDQ